MNHIGHLAGPSHDTAAIGDEKKSILGGLAKDDWKLQSVEQAGKSRKIADITQPTPQGGSFIDGITAPGVTDFEF